MSRAVRAIASVALGYWICGCIVHAKSWAIEHTAEQEQARIRSQLGRKMDDILRSRQPSATTPLHNGHTIYRFAFQMEGGRTYFAYDGTRGPAELLYCNETYESDGAGVVVNYERGGNFCGDGDR